MEVVTRIADGNDSPRMIHKLIVPLEMVERVLALFGFACVMVYFRCCLGDFGFVRRSVFPSRFRLLLLRRLDAFLIASPTIN